MVEMDINTIAILSTVIVTNMISMLVIVLLIWKRMEEFQVATIDTVDEFARKFGTFRASIGKTIKSIGVNLTTGGGEQNPESWQAMAMGVVKDVSKDIILGNPTLKKYVGDRLEKQLAPRPGETEDEATTTQE